MSQLEKTKSNDMDQRRKSNETLFSYIREGVSPYHVVDYCAKQLKEAGFRELYMTDTWNMQEGGKYLLRHHNSSLFAFVLPKNLVYKDGFRIAAAHTDYPCLRIKPHADMTKSDYSQLNVEVYGGAILNTWLDRPLGVAGLVAIRTEDVFAPRLELFSSEKPILTIPNLAIHMNREVNKGVELNKQKDLLPVMDAEGNPQKEGAFLTYLAEQLQVKKEDILSYDLCIVPMEEPTYIGLDETLISAPRLDNLTSVAALVEAIKESKANHKIHMIALFDHEEIGSRTKQGAGSVLLSFVMEKIFASMNRTPSQWKEDFYKSFLLSVDVAHAMHPNATDKMDPVNQPKLNKGICIKQAAAQSYATDVEAIAVVRGMMEKLGLPVQDFVNRSDMPGGSTLGSILSSQMPILTVDIGVPILAMHSARETMGAYDQADLESLMRGFFTL